MSALTTRTVDILAEAFFKNYENKAEARQDILEIINEIKNTPQDIINGLTELRADYKISLLDDCKCPCCGKSLSWVSDKAEDTFVPYGERYVSMNDGGHYECEECGYVRH